jgi:hypothetical protein
LPVSKDALKFNPSFLDKNPPTIGNILTALPSQTGIPLGLKWIEKIK